MNNKAITGRAMKIIKTLRRELITFINTLRRLLCSCASILDRQQRIYCVQYNFQGHIFRSGIQRPSLSSERLGRDSRQRDRRGTGHSSFPMAGHHRVCQWAAWCPNMGREGAVVKRRLWTAWPSCLRRSQWPGCSVFPGAPARDAHEDIPGRAWRIIGRARRFRRGRPVRGAAS